MTEQELFKFDAERSPLYAFSLVNGIQNALAVITERYEQTPGNELAYHNSQHTFGVLKRIDRLTTAIRARQPFLLSPAATQLALYIGATHDIVQGYQIEITKDGKGKVVKKRKRFSGHNEEQSAAQAIDYLEQTNIASGESVFPLSDMQLVREAHLLTVPTFDEKKGTIIQEGFAERSLIAQIVALADLGGSGMEGSATLIADTVSLFVEENPDYAAYSQNLRKGKIPSRNKEKEREYYDRFCEWTTSQTPFTNGRQNQVRQDILTMDPRVREPVRQQFTHFNDALCGIQDFAKEIERRKDFESWSGLLSHIIT